MSNLTSMQTSTGMPVWQAENLALVLDECDVPLTSAERRSLTLVAGFDRETVVNIAKVIELARSDGYDNGINSVWTCYCDRCKQHYVEYLRAAVAKRLESSKNPEKEAMFVAICGAVAADVMATEEGA